jgi:hypothetical protein
VQLQNFVLEVLNGLDLVALDDERLLSACPLEYHSGDKGTLLLDVAIDLEVGVVVAKISDVFAIEGVGGTGFLGLPRVLELDLGEFGEENVVLDRAGKRLRRDDPQLRQLFRH